MNKKSIKSISLNEIAEFSPWPLRLLSLESFDIRHKTSFEINREFGDEKWGQLLKSFKMKSTFNLDDIESEEQDLDQEIPCFENSLGFYLIKAKDAQVKQLSIFESVLSKYINRSSALVELGAGYGSKIIRLSNISAFNNMPLYAAEYTKSGCDLINLIASKTNKNIEVGYCDFDQLKISGIKIPENSIIFTSYAVHYIPEVKEEFVNFLNIYKPSVVVHFEPCYEYFDSKSLHGLMCKRYMILNGYTKNIASAIEDGCNRLGASVHIKKNVYGSNPFLPFSIIEWMPDK